MDDAKILRELVEALAGRTISQANLNTRFEDNKVYSVELVFTTGEKVYLTAGSHWLDWMLSPATSGVQHV